MHDNAIGLNGLRRQALRAQTLSPPAKDAASEKQYEEEVACPAYGYLRGVADRGLVVEFRLRNGDREWLPFSWLGPFRYNPSVGLLLRFTGDRITLILIRGSNLDAPVGNGSMTLLERGLQRHRITFLREMDEDELRKAGEGEPTIDRIEIAEFDTQEDVRAWLQKTASVFLRE